MRILLVDLGDTGSERLARALSTDAHLVEVVHALSTAVWVCRDAPPESPSGVAVVVLCLPRADPVAEDLGRRLREAELSTPLLVVAGEAGPDDVVAALDAGADDYVTRPVRLAEVCARVRVLARREVWTAGATTLVVVDDLRLDVVSHTVTRAGTQVDLSPHLFALLEVFARHPGQVLTRDILLEAVWHPSLEPQSNVVEQAVAALRRRIDTPFGRTSLRTVRGRGYRLDPAN